MKLYINIVKCVNEYEKVRLISSMSFNVKPMANFKDVVKKCTMLLDENFILKSDFTVFLELEHDGKKYMVDNTLLDVPFISCAHVFALLDEFSDMDTDRFHQSVAKLVKEMGWTT